MPGGSEKEVEEEEDKCGSAAKISGSTWNGGGDSQRVANEHTSVANETTASRTNSHTSVASSEKEKEMRVRALIVFEDGDEQVCVEEPVVKPAAKQ
jgi:tRNA G26 N,N-dimethylase Trm1